MRLADESEIDAACLLSFNYDYPSQPVQVSIDTEEFTAVCPWTGLPDYGTLTVTYTPGLKCIELKSFKYYLLSYRDVGIVQEHAANRILNDLVDACHPRSMKVDLDYKTRGGIHTSVSVAIFGASGLISNRAQMKMRLVCNNAHSVRPERSGEVNTASKRRSAEAVLTSPRSRRACPEFSTGPISAVALSRSSCSYPDDRPWTIPAQAGT